LQEIATHETETPTMFYLEQNTTKRQLPEAATSHRIMQTANRRNGESIGFDNGGDTALLLDADGKTLASWQFDQR
jgi:hypothetical protein